jgi:hypothetical protein
LVLVAVAVAEEPQITVMAQAAVAAAVGHPLLLAFLVFHLRLFP